MIDILLVLLVFFMSISSTEMLQSNQDVNLPVAREAKESKKNPGQVIVNVLYNAINNQTVIEVDERAINLGQLAPMLQAKVGANPFVRVLVRADKEVRYEFMRGLARGGRQSRGRQRYVFRCGQRRIIQFSRADLWQLERIKTET